MCNNIRRLKDLLLKSKQIIEAPKFSNKNNFITAFKYVKKITKLLLNPQYVSVKVDGEKSAVRLDEIKIAEIFTGRYFDMLVLCYEVAKENFFDTTVLCSLPTGLVNALASIKSSLAANFQTNLNAQSLSTEQSSAE